MQRVQKILSNYGYCSRREAERLIIKGEVKVNGKTITIGDKASEDDEISVNNKIIKKQNRVYIIFNKPPDCVTALNDKKYKTIFSYINIKERIYPVGRLDFNTSGLLLLTNDGDFANSIMHPRYEIKKTYVAEINKPIEKNDILTLQKGVHLKDGVTYPAKVKQINPTKIEITIHEGKKRIVRRMLKELGYHVKTLKRIRIGNLELKALKQGFYRKLKENEINKIFT